MRASVDILVALLCAAFAVRAAALPNVNYKRSGVVAAGHSVEQAKEVSADSVWTCEQAKGQGAAVPPEICI
ncbi:hypothetical protein FA15DRAFT_665161 [Coprinopsis marcescibilis]|uniref:Uncharacterized protein n=1 Tax=Coprinopsis marcescibilis TaxID=230819 RepID=A0A5C3L6V1_COPMA|nr:hypothetical protein FA15DRAFT_665161 [Coprinopsis marcescibilis]